MTNTLPKPFFVLAPMDDVTDTVFRQMVAECAPPDLFFTEFVNVDGLMSPGRPNLLKKLRFVKKEGQVIAQLWGLKPENFRAVADQIASGSLAKELGLPENVNFAGVDLNMGCPAKSEVKNGACAALIRRESWPLAHDIIEATREGLAGRLPLSVKTRVGFSAVDMEWFDFLLGHGLGMLTVHGRTRKQMSKVPADWSLIGQVRQKRDDMGVQTLIVGNGDVQSRKHGKELAQKHKLDGIMIGRGIFQDPYIFSEDCPLKLEKCDEISKIDLFRRHVELFAATWQHGERPIHTLNKFCKVYIQGFDGASALRAALMNTNSTVEILALLDNHLTSVQGRPKLVPRPTYNDASCPSATAPGTSADLHRKHRYASDTSEAPGTAADDQDIHQDRWDGVLVPSPDSLASMPLVASGDTVPYDDDMNKTIKAIVFDSDGTLLDSRKMIFEGFKEVLKRHDLEHIATDQYIRQRLGKPTAETFEQIIAGHATHLDPKVLAQELDDVQGGSMLHLIQQYPHTKDILYAWKNNGVKLCLFTSGYGYMVDRNFTAAGIPEVRELFDAIVTADDGLAHKPEPDAILSLLKQVEVEPSNAVVIGDHAYDIIAGGRARVGLKIGILHGIGTQRELLGAGADFLADGLDSLNHLMNFATS
ncbi:tRNA-dihydrouridine synthase [Candidatus Saccharibacteria bacterium]|nr:tRNA-dihydrouridine synthase [Candidatus Saccharibacteria bacterium]